MPDTHYTLMACVYYAALGAGITVSIVLCQKQDSQSLYGCCSSHSQLRLLPTHATCTVCVCG